MTELDTTSANNALFQIKNLALALNNKSILSLLNFDINQGELVAVIGPNGAGKTSLLKCLFGEYQPMGEVLLKEQNIASFSRNALAKKIAVVSQHENNSFDLSVIDIVRMGLVPHKALFEQDNANDKQLIATALERVDLIDKQLNSFKTLSGGEQQRVLIARALVQQADILILDEPTNHLDVYYQHQILALVKSLNLTVIVTIHDLNLAAEYSDRILLLNQGQQVLFDTPEKVLNKSTLRQVFKLDCLIDIHPFNQKIRVTFANQTFPALSANPAATTQSSMNSEKAK